MRIARFLPTVSALLFLNIAVSAQSTILVPVHFPTIQQGIDAAEDGDTVLVSPGTYFENIDFLGKAITVNSSSLDPADTVIDANGIASAVRFRNAEGPESVLEGFTVQGGSGVLVALPGFDAVVGGGIFIDRASPTIRGNLIRLNAVPGWGGGIFCQFSDVLIEENVIQDNSAGFAGGGLAIAEFSHPTIRSNAFISNDALSWGGALVNYTDSYADILDNYFLDNFATNGGAILSTVTEGASIVGNHFRSNEAVEYGGAVETGNFAGDVNIESNEFYDNLSGLAGGGFDHFGAGVIKVTLNVFHGNHSDVGGALSVEDSGSGVTITSNTIVGNAAGSYGGGIRVVNSLDTTITDTICWDNSATLGSPGIVTFGGSPPLVTYCCLQEPYPGVGNIVEDPQLEDPVAEDFHLKSGSPCIDAGDDAAPDLPPTDFDGDDRIICLHTDIGADEFVPPGGLCGIEFVRGDINHDDFFDIADPIFGLGALFVSGSPTPDCMDAADANDDGTFDIGDPITMLSALFVAGSPPPPAPHPGCGLDPTPDGLGCDSYGFCP